MSSSSKTDRVAPPLIDFPCVFPIKVMGRMHDDFAQTMANLILNLDPKFNVDTIELKPSAKSNYLSLTLYVNAQNQPHLDNIYRALSTHPMVLMVI